MASASRHRQRQQQAQAQAQGAAEAGGSASPAQDSAAFLHAVQNALVPLTRTASQLPSSSDLDFHRSLNPALANKLDAHTHALVALVNALTAWVDPDNAAAAALAPTAIHASLAAGVPRPIGDIVDSLLERADISLDEYQGRREPKQAAAFTLVKGKGKERASPSSSSSSQQQQQQGQLEESAGANARGKAKQQNDSAPLPSHIINAPIKKPQRLFTTKPDNRSNVPWSRPLRLGKPHATVPLAQAGANRPGGPDPKQIWKKPKTRQGMFCSEGDPEDNYYFTEILEAELPAHALEVPTPVRSQPLDPEAPEAPTDAGPFTWVDTAEGIHALAAHLNEDRVREIAIDLEHTSYRSFMGLTCLMQISTRWGDWIVDTLADAVRESAERLNESFADPRKIKVLHGADHDVLWMQRDLGLYVVGLFDTYQAAVILDYPMRGLAYLLERFCGFHADKRYQLADWRIRPLPKEMLYYAREDTHDLLYIYDCIRTELRSQRVGGDDPSAAITAVFQRSKTTAARTYARDVWDEEGLSRDGWKSLVVRWGPSNSTPNVPRQHWLVRALHRWRDEVARREDESPKFVLSAQHLLSLASKAPRSPQETLNLIKAGPRELKARLGELTKLICDEIAAFEKHARDEAEALQLAAMGISSSGSGGGDDAMDESDDDDDDEEEDEEETGEKVERLPEGGEAKEDVDMFEVDRQPGGVPAAPPPSSTVPRGGSGAGGGALIGDVRTDAASSPQVAALSLWTGAPAPPASTVAKAASGVAAAEGNDEKQQVKPKRSLFSLPAGFSGKQLFGGFGGSSKTAPPKATPAAAASSESKPGAGVGVGVNADRPAPQSTLFGPLERTLSTASRSSGSGGASSSSSSFRGPAGVGREGSAVSTKASSIRAGFAAAVGGMVGSVGSRASKSEADAVSSGGGDYATSAEDSRAGFTAAAASSSSSTSGAGLRMPSGKALSAVTQKLLSRGFHNNHLASALLSGEADGDVKGKPASANGNAGEGQQEQAEDDASRDLSAFGGVVTLKKRKERKGKKRGLQDVEAVENDGDSGSPSSLLPAQPPTSKKARTEADGGSSSGNGAAPPKFLKPFDLDRDASVLDMPAPAASGSQHGKASRGKGGGKKGGGGGSGGGTGFGPAPRKRNELSSGNRSATFR